MNKSNKKLSFELSHTSGVMISDDALLEDLRLTIKQLGKTTLSARLYQQHGRYSHMTFLKRFGSWNEALLRAGLGILNEFNIPDEKLFENIEQLWMKLGRQPVKRDLVPPLSKYSEQPYVRRFSSWRKALENFIVYVNLIRNEKGQDNKLSSPTTRQRTSRDPNWRLRFLVMRRDNFRCILCGASPALKPGLILHIDHKVPWSKGGETVIENLQTLCSQCNIGKSNLSDQESG